MTWNELGVIVVGAPVLTYWFWVKGMDKGPRRKPGSPPPPDWPIDPILFEQWEADHAHR